MCGKRCLALGVIWQALRHIVTHFTVEYMHNWGDAHQIWKAFVRPCSVSRTTKASLGTMWALALGQFCHNPVKFSILLLDLLSGSRSRFSSMPVMRCDAKFQAPYALPYNVPLDSSSKYPSERPAKLTFQM